MASWDWLLTQQDPWVSVKKMAEELQDIIIDARLRAEGMRAAIRQIEKEPHHVTARFVASAARRQLEAVSSQLNVLQRII